MRWAIGAAWCLGWLAATGVCGAEAPAELEEIVVVAHKAPRSLEHVAANVSVVTRADLDAQLAVTLDDVFRYVPGIDTTGAGSRFGTEGISLRGIDGNRVALVFDGVPLAQQFSVGRFSNAARDFVDSGLIERVEVLHGPASALYGSSAIGGVVVMRSPRPSDLVADGALAGGDARLTHDARDDRLALFGRAAVGSDALGATTAVSLSRGRTPDSAAPVPAPDTRERERLAALLSAQAADREGRSLRLGLMHQDLDSVTELRSMLGSGRFRSTTRLAGDDRSVLQSVGLDADLSRHDGALGQMAVSAYLQRLDVEQHTLDERAAARRPVRIARQFQYRQDIRGVEINLQREIATRRAEHRIGAGIEWSEHRTEEQRSGWELGLDDGRLSTTVLGERFPVRDFPVTRVRELGAYLEDSVTLGRWTLIAALRAERYRLDPEPDALYREDNPDLTPVTLDQSNVAPKLGAVVDVTDALDVYAQYARGYRAPPFEDANLGFHLPLFNYRAIPNPDLRAEVSDGIEIGMRVAGALGRGHVGLFHTRYRDFIASKVRLGTDPADGALLFQSINLDEATIEGLEASWRIPLRGAFRNVALDAGAWWARGKNDASGAPLNAVGPPQATLAVDWTATDARTSASLRATATAGWTRRDESAGALFEPPGHAVIDVFLHRELSPRVRLSASVRNLTDRVYWHWADVRGLAPDDPVLGVLAAPGRSASVSISARW